MKNTIKAIGLILAFVTSSAQAVPTLFFNGDIAYNASDNTLSVSSKLIGTYDIAPAPILDGTLDFDALLLSSFSFGGWTIGSFGTVPGQDDLVVKDFNSMELLTGNFSSLTMSGEDGTESGTITGSMIASGGSLAAHFGIGQVIALQFNLSSSFSDIMFESDFVGNIDGNIEGQVPVPEPGMLGLLSLGIFLLGLANRKNTRYSA